VRSDAAGGSRVWAIGCATGSSGQSTRGASGVRRGIVLGVVLGEDEGLPADVQDDFRASGLYHLLAVSGQNVAFLAAGVFGLGWLLRLPASRASSRRSP
jgi:predicted membrane metal-binding protein